MASSEHGRLDTAEAVCGHPRSRFSVGAISVQLVGGCLRHVNLGESLEPFQVNPGPSEIDVAVEWVLSIPEAPHTKLFDSGTTWKLHECDAGFRFDFNAAVFGLRPMKRLTIDRRFVNASLQMSEECFAQLPREAGPLGYPLDELLIMHRLTQERGIELHSCGIVGPDGVGNLFVGHSGAGKSTTTRLWTAHKGVEILSDDRIIVREQAGQMLMYGTPWHGEAKFASPNSCALRRIFVLEQGLGNKIIRLSPMQAISELFARSFVPFYEPKYVDAALDFLQSLVASVPCYRYEFEPTQAAVERVLNLRD